MLCAKCYLVSDMLSRCGSGRYNSFCLVVGHFSWKYCRVFGSELAGHAGSSRCATMECCLLLRMVFFECFFKRFFLWFSFRHFQVLPGRKHGFSNFARSVSLTTEVRRPSLMSKHHHMRGPPQLFSQVELEGEIDTPFPSRISRKRIFFLK